MFTYCSLCHNLRTYRSAVKQHRPAGDCIVWQCYCTYTSVLWKLYEVKWVTTIVQMLYLLLVHLVSMTVVKTWITWLLLVFRQAHLFKVLRFITWPARRTHQRCAELARSFLWKHCDLTTKVQVCLPSVTSSCHWLCLRVKVVTASHF